MSSHPEAPSLEFLRKRAKDLLRAARRGEIAALSQLRHVPRLRSLSAEQLRIDARLADAQHAVAREQGSASWMKLLAEIDTRQPLDVHAARLLAAVRENDRRAAERVLERWSAAADVDLWSACAAGRDRRVAELLGRDGADVAVVHAGDGWQPILYASASPLHRVSAEHGRGIRRSVELLLAAGADPNAYTLYDGDDTNSKLSALFAPATRATRRWLGCSRARCAAERWRIDDHAAELDHRAA